MKRLSQNSMKPERTINDLPKRKACSHTLRGSWGSRNVRQIWDLTDGENGSWVLSSHLWRQVRISTSSNLSPLTSHFTCASPKKHRQTPIVAHMSAEKTVFSYYNGFTIHFILFYFLVRTTWFQPHALYLLLLDRRMSNFEFSIQLNGEACML